MLKGVHRLRLATLSPVASSHDKIHVTDRVTTVVSWLLTVN